MFCFAAVCTVQANNIQITGISYSAPNLSFTIQWDNSWNTSSNANPLYPSNWDAAWVFVKYQSSIDNLWKHTLLSSVSSDHNVTGGILQVDAVSDGMGVFIRRSAPGSGNISASVVTIKLNTLAGTGPFNFKVFGTEMTYIPQSVFRLGDGRVSGTSFFTAQDIDATKQSSGITAGSLFSGSPALPATFPMGYNSFYMMKYEITNEEWADFLNALTYDQQVSRMDIAPNGTVNSYIYANNVNTMTDNVVKLQTAGLNNTLPAVFGCDLDGDNVFNEINDGQNIACGNLSKADLFAYLDWCGMRPMTETEFEKSCRGTQAAVVGEYAWGTTDVSTHVRTQLSNNGMPNEAWTGAQASGQVMVGAGLNSSGGPARSGLFANGTNGRLAAGAGFYGNMELSGSIWEICVLVDAGGVSFTGNNGDGMLTVTGDANTANWPGNYTAAAGSGTTIRGGSFFEISNYTSYISASFRNGGLDPARNILFGGRGVRSVP